ncbi:MAG TPA: hypothetical protein VJ917_07510, partial [Saprospiraceae bacterium]|nr:hypothetical protein [Saprospiraceae bacterium]
MIRKIFNRPLFFAIILLSYFNLSTWAQVISEKPLAICNCQLTFAYNSDCQLIVKAEDIDAGSYSPGGEDLTLEIFDYYREPQEEILYEEACYGIDLRWIYLIVTSESGLSDTCRSLVELQRGSCTEGISYFCDPCFSCGLISGSFYTPTGIPINVVDVYFNGHNERFNQHFCYSHEFSNYYFPDLIVEPQKEDDIQRGLSVLDMVLIRAAHLEKVELSHFQKIAGDISDSERVSLLDAIELKQVLLYGLEEFSQSPVWRFIPANHEFGADTWERPIPNIYEIDYESHQNSFDFIGVKMGDVSGDSWGRSHARSTEKYVIHTEDRYLREGEIAEIQFHSRLIDQISGYQFTLEYDPDQLEFIDIGGSITQADLNLNRVNEGLIGVVMLQDQDTEDLLFTTEFKASRNLQLSQNLSLNSTMIPALAY